MDKHDKAYPPPKDQQPRDQGCNKFRILLVIQDFVARFFAQESPAVSVNLELPGSHPSSSRRSPGNGQLEWPSAEPCGVARVILPCDSRVCYHGLPISQPQYLEVLRMGRGCVRKARRGAELGEVTVTLECGWHVELVLVAPPHWKELAAFIYIWECM